MTFCGDLPFVPSGINHHLFENLRRKGHHCHGLTHLSRAERKIFYRVLGKKFCGLFIYPGQSVRQVVAVSAPGDRDSYGCVAPAGMSRDPPQRRRARARNGVAPYIPAAFCRDAGSAGHGATEAARPERSLQARVSRQGWKPARAETASLAPFTTARPARGTPGKGISRRTTKQTVIRAAEKRRTVAVAVAVAGTTTSSVTGK